MLDIFRYIQYIPINYVNNKIYAINLVTLLVKIKNERYTTLQSKGNSRKGGD